MHPRKTVFLCIFACWRLATSESGLDYMRLLALVLCLRIIQLTVLVLLIGALGLPMADLPSGFTRLVRLRACWFALLGFGA